MATKPNAQYQSVYSTMIDDLVGKAINRQPFQYDPATDPAYQAYARQYMRLGDEAGRDTLADVSAQTGGLPSSYAVTASQQARNAYNMALTDKIPSLMETAYNKYRNEYNDMLAGIGTLQGLDDSGYNRFATDRSYERGVYENDRDYDRGVYESDRDFDEGVRQYNQNYELDKGAQEYERMLNAWNTLGYATKEVAKYFGVPEGTKTSDAYFKEAELALQRARMASSGSSGGGGGRSGGGSGSKGGSSGGSSGGVDPNTIEDTKNARTYLARLQGYLIAQGNSLSAEDRMTQIQNNLNGAMKNGNLTKGEVAFILDSLYGSN